MGEGFDFPFTEIRLRRRVRELEAQVIRLQMQLGKTDYIDQCLNPDLGWPVFIRDETLKRDPKLQIKQGIYEDLVKAGKLHKRRVSRFGAGTEYTLRGEGDPNCIRCADTGAYIEQSKEYLCDCEIGLQRIAAARNEHSKPKEVDHEAH